MSKSAQKSTFMGNVAFVATALCAVTASADTTIAANMTLTADTDWRTDGVVTVPQGVTVDLAGHTLWVAGLAGAGTFMSPCEKECGNAIYEAGGSLIVLSPEGFSARSHPPRSKEALCAKGRMLFLSLWEPTAAKPDNATLYKRCHEMGDILLGAKRLGKSKTLR